MAQDTTDRQFSALIKEYMPLDMMKEEIIKRDWFLQNSSIDQNYKGGTLYVPFKAAKPRNFRYGNYVSDSGIKRTQYVKAKITGYKEVWGSLKFDDSDLSEHGDMKTSFLKILPNHIDDMLVDFREMVSQAFLNGAWMCRVTADSASADGKIIVDRPEKLELDQRVVIVEYTNGYAAAATHYIGNDSASVGYKEAYVKSINMESNEVVIADASGTALDLSAGGEDLDATPYACRIFPEDGENADNQFLSLRSASLSALNGGAAELYGETKLSYPYLQSQNYDGSTINATNILEKIFGFYTTTKRVGKGLPKKIVLSDKHGSSIKKALEVSRTYEAKDTKASVYGWEEMTIGGAKGQLDIVIVNEIDDDIILTLDPRSWKVYSNGFFERREDPDGKAYYTVRGDTGTYYIVDVRFFGEMVVHTPSYNAIIHGVSY